MKYKNPLGDFTIPILGGVFLAILMVSLIHFTDIKRNTECANYGKMGHINTTMLYDKCWVVSEGGKLTLAQYQILHYTL